MSNFKIQLNKLYYDTDLVEMVTVIVDYDPSSECHVVRLFIDGIENNDASYETCDWHDAVGTAYDMLRRN